MAKVITEDHIEQAAVRFLKENYQYRSMNCLTAERETLNDGSGRSSKDEVLLWDVLKTSAYALNPQIPKTDVDAALSQLGAGRRVQSPLTANKEIYRLIRDGIPVDYENAEGRKEHGRARLIDFDNPFSAHNDFMAVTQLWIKGDSDHTYRRPDILIYINGLPLVFIELKNSDVKLKTAYDDNLTNYRHDIPALFHCNAFCILSNGMETRIGSFTADYDYFYEWLRADVEGEKIDRKAIGREGTSLERLLKGLFPKDRLLDYIENFILFYGEKVKVVAQNHQYLGVNNAYQSFLNRKEKNGKLGVFWHTQGSGKSFSMIFLCRKIFHKCVGNFTFVVVTDRDDLDKQIYKNFLETETVRESDVARPRNSGQMRELLGRNLRLVFTLIHKFRFDKGKEYPTLSERDDIIVIVDEAHRTQYKSLAENMRKGLKNAQYIAFTGTPLLGKDRKTNAWFGEYVSEYNYAQSIEDGTTVPLFYQKRVPEVLIQNDDLSDEFYQILEDENLDEQAQEKLEREFSKEMEIIKRDDRLETIARDIVYHFPRRGYLGKGMVISVDKFTCVRMYDKVQHHWKEELKQLRGEIKNAIGYEKQRLQKRLEYMNSVEMTVIISEDAGEEERFTKQGLNIKLHRDRMNKVDANGHDIEYRYKDPQDAMQLVFVCAMWLTGFDAPTVSTLYLDKPMKDHTLMQTIARANRVTSYTVNGVSKANGEIIDYYNVFRNMKRALADYALGDDRKDETPVQDKSNLFTLLDDAILQGVTFCESVGVNLTEIQVQRDTFSKLGIFEAYSNQLLEKEEYWKEFKVYENTISGLHEACKPEILETKPRPMVAIFQYLRGVVESIIEQADIDSARLRISELLDQSVVTADGDSFTGEPPDETYQIIVKGKTLDLSKLNFEKLREDFPQKEYKNIEIAELRSFLEHKLEAMLCENSTRSNFAVRLQMIIDRYNSGGSSTENYFEDLLKYAENLKEEDERHVREGLTAEELELYDVLRKEKMTKEEEIKVKNAAKHLLRRLVEEQPKVLVQDWYKDSQSIEKVKSALQEVLDTDLPESYDRSLFQEKSGQVYQMIYEYAVKGLKWVA